VVLVEGHVEAGEVGAVLVADALDEFFRLDALGARLEHDRGAVGIVGAHVDAAVPAHALEAHPDVGLDVFHQVAQVDRAVGVGQGAGDQDLPGGRGVVGGLGHGCTDRREK